MAMGIIGWIMISAVLIWNYSTFGPVIHLTKPPVPINEPRPGERLLVRWWFEHLDDCPAQAQIWTIDRDGNSVLLRYADIETPAGVVVDGKAWTYPIPTWLEPGSYELYTMLTKDCGGILRARPQRLPPIPFVIRGTNE